MSRVTAEERFHAGYIPEPTSGCWLWLGRPQSTGYGQLHVSGKRTLAHRYSWELEIGPIPDGMYVLHRCDNRLCVNPDHLFVGTHQDNMDDMVRKGRCPTGEDHWNAKLTRKDVTAIRKSTKSQRALAREYGVGQKNISHIITERTWK
jgi:hypothetical protein